jgi:hypothetical protein
MLEIVLGIAVVVMMAKVANADDQSAVTWGGLTFLLCVASVLFVPLPFLRMLLAGAAVFALMIGYKMVAER